jgi:hypothetical protein
MRLLLSSLLVVLVAALLIGCSSGYNPMIGESSVNLDDIGNFDLSPIITLDEYSAIGLFGAYNLAVSPEGPSADLMPVRTSALGEAYIVSGKPFFTITPCADCFKIKNIALDEDSNILIGFSIRHPFPKGDTGEEPTASNRLDLDVFDLAMFVSPRGILPADYPLTSTQIQSDYLLNADGYSKELEDFTDYPSATPYKICVANSNNNRFEMGSSWKHFEIVLPAQELYFDLFLTMGYGASAKRPTRLNPVYYIPEFNRKAAWKVVVTPPQGENPPDIGNTWNAANLTTEYEVTIDIYDWNHGGQVAPDFPDPVHPNLLSALSDIESVTVEVPGMTNALVWAPTTDTTTNGWDDPMTYIGSFANENSLGVGEYPALVKVTDSREPSQYPVGTDTLIDTPDGMQLDGYTLSEFATYQTFVATVVMGPPPEYDHGDGIPGYGIRDNGEGLDVDDSGNVYITGSFEGVDVDFNPEAAVDLHSSNGGYDAYLTKYDSGGNYLWTVTWGGMGIWDEGFGLAIHQTSLYVTGHFEQTVDFDPSLAGVDNHTALGDGRDIFLSKFDLDGNLQWAITWGALGTAELGIWDEGHGIGMLSTGDIIVTGIYSSTVDFDPGAGNDSHTSNGDDDVFISRFTPSGGYVWTETFGGQYEDGVNGIDIDNSDRILITGFYMDTVDFDPGAGTDLHTSNGFKDIYFSRFASNGAFDFAKTWGSYEGFIFEDGFDIAADASNNIFVTGRFEGTVDFDPGPSEFIIASIGIVDTFLSKFSNTGNFEWVKTWSGMGIWDEGHGVAIDSFDFVYVIGNFEGTADFNPGPGVNEFTSNGGQDVFVSKFTNDGSYVLTLTWGGDEFWDEGHAIVIDNSGAIYTKGCFSGTVDLDPGDGVDEKTSLGDPDVFSTRLSYN